MIIRSIRLKNIKSFGSGEDNKGVTVGFQSGVNRIAGRNGHGKSTLIEAIGFALFLAKPNYEETFAIDTYLLRNGSKEGEIDVSFEYKGQAFRVERGLGKASKRRTKVIDLLDDSICAEGDTEVSDFLRHLLGLPSADHLGEIFSKLIGVKQGRLTWPFDSKPSQAKKFFEPLFDVAVFRDCFDKLKPSRDQFAESFQEAQVKNAGVMQKISDRADSKEKLKEANELVAKFEKEEKEGLKSVEEAAQKKLKLETQEKAQIDAANAFELAKNSLSRADDRLKTNKEQLEQSEKAVAEVAKNQSAHEAFRSAEETLGKLEEKREQRDALKSVRDKTNAKGENLLTKAEAAEAQRKSFLEQKETKVSEQKMFDRKFAELDKKLSLGKEAFDTSTDEIRKATEHHSTIGNWIAGLTNMEKRLASAAGEIHRLDTEISSWEPTALASAKGNAEKAEIAFTESTATLYKATERQTTLKAQLGQISGGVCPFLKETCRQFDPKKVQGDLASAETVIKELTAQVANHQDVLTKAKQAFEPLQKMETQIAERKEALKSMRKGYLAELSNLCPHTILKTIDALVGWDERFEPLPNQVELPKTELASGRIQTLQAAVADFISRTRSWWMATDNLFCERAADHDKNKWQRTRDLETVSQLIKRSTETAKEVSKLTEQIAAKEGERKQATKLAKESAENVKELDEQLKPFASLAEQIKAQQKQKGENRKGYEDFLKAKKLADELAARKEALDTAKNSHANAQNSLKEKDAILKKAKEAFDPEKLKQAKEAYQTKRDAITSIQTNLTHARKGMELQQSRYKEWLAACEEREQVIAEMDRLQAAIDLTELARKLLQKAAPAVAQNLCNRIAANAQILYNRINPNPIELSWDANRYSVKIVPGDRRFAMLSGGEQTKLALALTLAMIEEFGGLSFCIFDEPTYGVDADSRQKLADAIIEAQSAAGLEQLLLVSHDDAFEGKIEHAILLNKSASSGSELVTSN